MDMTTSHPHSSEKEREKLAVDIMNATGGKYTDEQEEAMLKLIDVYAASAHQSAEAALLEKLQPLLVIESRTGSTREEARNELKTQIRTALKPPKEEDV